MYYQMMYVAERLSLETCRELMIVGRKFYYSVVLVETNKQPFAKMSEDGFWVKNKKIT